MTALPHPRAGHDNHFNLIRLLLAVAVILAHAFELVDGDRAREPLTVLFGTFSLGEAAVNGFFLLSGFLIVQSWNRDPRLGAFLRKRVLRIYPGFLVASLVSILVVGALAAPDVGAYLHALRPVAILKNLALLHDPATPPTFPGTFYPLVNAVLWTISFEFRCYLLVALFGACGLFRNRLPWALLFLGTLALSLFPAYTDRLAFPGSTSLLGPHPQLFFRLAAFFAAGGCFYLFRDRILYRRSWMLAAAPLLILGMFHQPWAQLAMATAGAYLFFGFAFARLPLRDGLVRGEDISYGVYLYGWPAEKLLLWYFPGLHPGVLFVTATALAAACGFASWRLVERPFLRLKEPSAGRRAATTLQGTKERA